MPIEYAKSESSQNYVNDLQAMQEGQSQRLAAKQRKETQYQILKLQQEEQAKSAEEERKRIEALEAMPKKWTVFYYQKGRYVNGMMTKGWDVAATFDTKEEAEKWAKENQPDRDTSRKVEYTKPISSYEAWGGEGSGGKLTEQQRLARQALEAMQKGEGISEAEKKAFSRTYQDGKKIVEQYQTERKSVREELLSTSGRRITLTPGGGTVNIPKSAKYSPGFEQSLAKPSGQETSKDIIQAFRKQEIDLSKLPYGSVVEYGGETYLASELVKAGQTKISPSYSALGNIASEVKYQKEMADYEKSLKRTASLSASGGAVNESRAVGNLNISSIGNANLDILGQKTQPEIQGLAKGQDSTLKRFGSGFLQIPVSLGKGFVKLGSPENWGDEQKGVSFLSIFGKGGEDYSKKIDTFWEKNFAVKNEIYKDTDIQMVSLVSGMSSIGSIAPTLAKALGLGFVGYQGYRTAKEPTPENFGVLAFMGASYGATKLYQKYGTTTKGNIKTDIYKNPVAELEKTATVKKVGNIKTVDQVTVRQSGDLKFQYQRMKVPEVSTGKNAPTVAVSKGNIQYGMQKYDLSSVQVGRQTYGTLRGTSQDILFRKTAEGDIFLKYLAKSGKVKKTATIKYQPENIKLKTDNVVFTRQGQKAQLDTGLKIGEQSFYDYRSMTKEGIYKAYGAQKEFTGMRDVQKIFLGKAKTTLTQKDSAAPQQKITQIGTERIIELTPADIKYALQPQYKPNIKKYTTTETSDGAVPISEYLRRPQLTTERINKFQSSTLYQFEKSGIKPLKAAMKSIPDMGKAGSVGLKKRVPVYTQPPKISPLKPETQPVMSLAEMESIMQLSRSATTPVLLALPQESRTDIVEIGRIEQQAKPETILEKLSKPVLEQKKDTFVRSFAQSKTNIKALLDSRTSSKAESRTLAQPKTVTFTDTLTKSQTRALTRAKTITMSQSLPGNFPYYSLYGPTEKPNVPPILPPFGGQRRGYEQGYEAYVKRFGQWLKVSGPLQKESALSAGARKAAESAAASFLIRKTKERVLKKKLDLYFRLKRGRYYSRTSAQGDIINIEKTRYRINTPGELSQITFKGIEARRKKGSAPSFNFKALKLL